MHVVFVDSNSVGLNALLTAKSQGHRVTFVSSRRFAPLIATFDVLRSPEYTDRIVDVEDSLDGEELLGALRRLDVEEKIDVLLTVLEFCVHAVASCAEALGVPGSRPSSVRLCQDKNACRLAIESAGLLSASHVVANTIGEAQLFADAVGYPVIAKPRKGAGSILAERIDDDVQLRSYYSRSREVAAHFAGAVSQDVLLEKYITGPLFSVELAAAGGEFAALIVSARKRCDTNPSIELGTTMPAPVSGDVAKLLSDYATDVAKAAGLSVGIFHIEIILSAEGPVLVEVNPRIMGGNMPTLFRRATDIDPYALLIEIFAKDRLPTVAKNVVAHRAAATRMIGFANAGQAKSDLQFGWDHDLRARTVAWSFNVEPGQEIVAMENSFHAHFFQVVRPTPAEASLLAEWIVGGIAIATGLPLRRSSEDYLPS